MSSEIVSLIASWPTAAVLLGGVFLATQRQALSRLLDRATKVSAGPATLEAAARAEQQQLEASKPVEVQALPPPTPGSSIVHSGPLPDRNPLYDDHDTQLRGQLEQAYGGNNEVKLAWAVRLRSQTLVERIHETHYRAMFTSQLLVLKQLNHLGMRTLSQARKIYDEAAVQDPTTYGHLNWETWEWFLRSTGYIQVGEGHDPIISLTPLGNDFQVWMAARRVLEVKAFKTFPWATLTARTQAALASNPSFPA
jgi:hypothetical protein